MEPFFAYDANYLIDNKAGIILDAEGTRANRIRRWPSPRRNPHMPPQMAFRRFSDLSARQTQGMEGYWRLGQPRRMSRGWTVILCGARMDSYRLFFEWMLAALRKIEHCLGCCVGRCTPATVNLYRSTVPARSS